MSHVNIWVHAVWGTKYRHNKLTKDIRAVLFEHILENAKKKDIHIDSLNGYLDHVHCLLKLGPEQNISKVMQLMKGEASFWANKNKLTPSKLYWADEYFAASACYDRLPVVRNYIRNQEMHHKVLTYAEDFERFMKEFGYQYLK
jgi:REP element-mobilizing transposase RayT